MKSGPELHLDHLGGLMGTEPEFQFCGPEGGSQSRITSITHPDRPEVGLLTSFTHGLSLAHHPDPRVGAPELLI